jgi:hypothetical protein
VTLDADFGVLKIRVSVVRGEVQAREIAAQKPTLRCPRFGSVANANGIRDHS